jgi:hypothetical protein
LPVVGELVGDVGQWSPVISLRVHRTPPWRRFKQNACRESLYMTRWFKLESVYALMRDRGACREVRCRKGERMREDDPTVGSLQKRLQWRSRRASLESRRLPSGEERCGPATSAAEFPSARQQELRRVWPLEEQGRGSRLGTSFGC